MLKDLKSKIDTVQLLEAKSQSAGAVKSNILDVKGFRGVVFNFNYGVFTPNTAVAGVTAKLQESDTLTDGDFTDVAAGDMIGTLAGVKVDASDDQRSEHVGYIGVKKYVRAVITVPANSTSLVCAVDAIVGLGDMPASGPTALSAA